MIDFGKRDSDYSNNYHSKNYKAQTSTFTTHDLFKNPNTYLTDGIINIINKYIFIFKI
jgi:hypothetical protein